MKFSLYDNLVYLFFFLSFSLPPLNDFSFVSHEIFYPTSGAACASPRVHTSSNVRLAELIRVFVKRRYSIGSDPPESTSSSTAMKSPTIFPFPELARSGSHRRVRIAREMRFASSTSHDLFLSSLFLSHLSFSHFFPSYLRPFAFRSPNKSLNESPLTLNYYYLSLYLV